MTTQNKWHKEIKQTVLEEGCVFIRIEQGKKHNKVHVELPTGEKRRIFTSVTPSDSRNGRLNFRNDIRRVKNEVKDGKVQKD